MMAERLKLESKCIESSEETSESEIESETRRVVRAKMIGCVEDEGDWYGESDF